MNRQGCVNMNRPGLAAVMAVAGLFALRGAAATWIGTTGSFTNAANWDTGVTPANGVTVTVDNCGMALLDGASVSVGIVNLGSVAGSAGSLSMSAGAFTNTYLFVGKAGTGTVEQTGGDVVVSSSSDPSLGIGYAATGVGSYTLSGGSVNMLSSGNLQVGAYGRAYFDQSGGAFTGRGWMVVGRYGPGGNGALTVSGGEFCQYSTAHRLIIAEGGTGSLVVTNTGLVSCNGGLRIGMVKTNPPNDAGTGTGTVWLCQGGTISTPEVLTLGGSSTFNFDGGLLAARGSRQTISGFFQGLTAAYVRSGGANIDPGSNIVTVNQNLLDDGTGAGGLTKTGEGVLALGGANTYAGGTVVSNGVLVALTPGALPGYGVPGRVTVCGGAGLTVGVGATGQWGEAEVGALMASGAFADGSQAGFDTTRTNVTIDIDLTGLGPFGLLKTGLNTLVLTAANGYTGRTVVKGGVLQADFGAGLPASTNVTLEGGTLSTAGATLALSLGEGPGQINIASNAPAGFSAYGSPLAVNLGGAAETLAWGSAAFSPNALLLNEVGANQSLAFENGLDLRGGARGVSVNATVAGSGVTLAGNIGDSVGGGGLTKGGPGALTLAGTNVYTGATYVTGGLVTLAPTSSNSVGEVQLSGSSRLSVGNATLRQTAGNFVVNGGSVDVAGGAVSNLAGSAYIGFNSGLGALAIDAGSFYTPSELNVGAWSGSTGSLTLTNGAVMARLLYVGRGGNGTVTQTGGSVKLTGSVGSDGWRIGGWSDTTAKGTGVYNLFGGELNTGGQNFQIGCSGNGTLYQTGGTATCGGWPVVGRFSGGIGTYTLEGGVFNQTGSGNKLIIGEVGSGTVNVRGQGCANLAGGLRLSSASGGSGTVNLEAGGTINTPIVDKGSGSSATFNFNGGTLRARGNGAVITNYMQGLSTANVLAGGAVVDSSNCTVTVVQSLRSGAAPDGGLTKRGTGTLTLSGTNTYNGATRIEAGRLKLGGAAGVPVGGAVTVAGGCYDLGGFTATNGEVTLETGSIVNGVVMASAYNLGEGVVLADLGGAGTLTKSGAGTLVLGGANTYEGDTVVEEGTLRVGLQPLHRWSFNGDLSDSMGGQAATAVGAVTSGDTQYTLAGNGAYGSSYIDLGPNILPADGVTPVTVELWATENATNLWSRIFDFGSDTANNMIKIGRASL